ncbi:hypothetical protein M1373_01495 [Candidatus Marsarchaeota archaeon]|nr:hypothetical protein [Candidatus Marsarchaeota archaeon]MCL5404972.1 hypothetical protein [Candidatus Marsarchaeota archaeon]
MAFVLLASISSAQSTTSVTCPFTGISTTSSNVGLCIAGAIPLALIGLLLSFLLIGIAFMVGNVLQIGSLRNWYQGELYEAAKSALLIVLIFAILIIVGAIALALAGSSVPVVSLPLNSSAYSSVSDNLNQLYAVDYSAYIDPTMLMLNESFYAFEGLSSSVGELKSTAVLTWIPIPIPFVGALQFGSSSGFLSSSVIESNLELPNYSFIKDFIEVVFIPVYFVLETLSSLLYYIVLIGLALFLPIGIVFRAIPFLRGLGGSFIAIGMAIGLIFPAMLVVFNVPMTNYIQPILYQQNTAPTVTCFGSGISAESLFTDALCVIAYPTYGTASDILVDAQTAGDPNANLYANSFENGWGGGMAIMLSGHGAIYPAFNIIGFYGTPVLFQFILIILDLVITLVIAGAIASMLGGKLSLGVGKFKIA